MLSERSHLVDNTKVSSRNTVSVLFSVPLVSDITFVMNSMFVVKKILEVVLGVITMSPLIDILT